MSWQNLCKHRSDHSRLGGEGGDLQAHGHNKEASAGLSSGGVVTAVVGWWCGNRLRAASAGGTEWSNRDGVVCHYGFVIVAVGLWFGPRLSTA